MVGSSFPVLGFWHVQKTSGGPQPTAAPSPAAVVSAAMAKKK
jgi:hypothetical protein